MPAGDSAPEPPPPRRPLATRGVAAANLRRQARRLPTPRRRRGARPGSAAAYEAEERRQEAFDIAWRYLAHRDRTEAEVRRNFTRKRIDPALVEEVVAALLEGGYVDDAAFAQPLRRGPAQPRRLGRRSGSSAG